MTCQLRLYQAERNMAWNLRSKAVSTKISFLSRGWVIRSPPPVPCEQVRHVLADQRQNLGQRAAISGVPLSWASRSLTVRGPLREGSPRVGDPIGGCVRLDESLRTFVCVLALLRSEYGRGPLAPARVPVLHHFVMFAHGSGFPFTDAISQKLRAVCLSEATVSNHRESPDTVAPHSVPPPVPTTHSVVVVASRPRLADNRPPPPE
jgi:hypothetical protein